MYLDGRSRRVRILIRRHTKWQARLSAVLLDSREAPLRSREASDWNPRGSPNSDYDVASPETLAFAFLSRVMRGAS
jgi:hypothetical protein